MVAIAAVLVVVTVILVGRAGEARCQRNAGWTHAEGQLFPPSLRCLGRQDGHEVVLDDATTYVRMVSAISASVSGGLFVVSLLGVRRALRPVRPADLWSDFP